MSTAFVRFKAMLKPILGPRVSRRLGRGLESLSLVPSRAREAVAMVRSLHVGMLTRQLAGVPPRTQSGMLERHVVLLVVSDIRVDPRVQKAAKMAVQSGFAVTVVSPHYAWMDEPGWEALDWGPGVSFEFPDTASPNFVNHWFPWLVNRRMYESCLRYRRVIFHCNDLNTALMGLHLARATGSLCIADFHEWFSENVSWSYARSAYVRHGPVKRAVMRRAERLCLRHADHGITVCDSIANELAAMEPGARRFTVIRNIPDMSAPAAGAAIPLRQQLGLPESAFVVLWQGGIGPSRLLEPVIESLRFAPDVHLVIRGPGLEPGAYYTRAYAELAASFGVQDRLTLLPPVPSREVVAAARGADAGIWTLPNLSKNFYYALPNKIFEYLAAGLPVLVANFPEAEGLVKRYGVGLSFDPYSPQSIAAAMLRLRGDPALARSMRANTQAALADMDAAAEWARLGSIYRELASRPAASTP